MGFVLQFSACTLFDEPEPTPAYIHLSQIDLQTTGDQGTASSKINIAWVYVDGDFIGGYQMPVTLPVLKDGPGELIIDPGVNENGISFTPEIYPFYKRIQFTHDFIPGQVDSFSLSTTYHPSTEFALIENFESSSQLFSDDLDNDNQTAISITSSGAFEGNSGLIKITKDHPIAIAATDYNRLKLDNLPRNGAPVWMELNYKTDVPVVFGIIAYDAVGTKSDFPEFGINPKNTWNKIYFDLSELLLQQSFLSFQIYVSTAIPKENGEFKQDEGNVYLDNIKILFRR